MGKEVVDLCVLGDLRQGQEAGDVDINDEHNIFG